MVTVARPLKAVARRAGIRRDRFAAMRMHGEREFLAVVAQRRKVSGRILCYHSVGTERWGVNDVSVKRFAEQIELALTLGYRFVTAQNVAEGRASEVDLAITFDDGVLSAATTAAPVLAAFGIPWTLFVVTDWADGRHGFGPGVVMGWRDVERLASDGVEIGSHSVSHPDFGSLPADQAADQLNRSRSSIERHLGFQPTAFAIPMGQSGNWSPEAARAAAEAGYEMVFAQSVAERPPHTIPRTFITRFDDRRIFRAALEGAFDGWEEWV